MEISLLNSKYIKLVGKISNLLVWAVLILATACTTEKKVEEKPVFNNDIINATEISMDEYHTEKSTTGYGEVKEVQNVSHNEQILFKEEINSAWYKLVIPDTVPDNTWLSFTLVPNDSTENYDFLMYKYTDKDFIKELTGGKIKPIRSNLAHKHAEAGNATGLACEINEDFVNDTSAYPFSKPVMVNKNEVYYLLFNTDIAEGKGYTIKFSTCVGGPGTGTMASAKPDWESEASADAAKNNDDSVNNTKEALSKEQQKNTASAPVKKAVKKKPRKVSAPSTAGMDNPPPMPEGMIKVPRRTSGVAAASTAEAQNKIEPNKEYFLYLHVYNESNTKPINTGVRLVDSKNPKQFSKIATNRVVAVTVRPNENKDKILVCEPFGYRKKEINLNLEKIINDSTSKFTSIYNDTIVVKFEMERYKKKDVVVMYNVFFYDDASVMLPVSKNELEILVELMNENKNIKVKLHGYTNGNQMGKIIKLEEGDKNFFAVTDKNKETYGSAVTLSKYRSESIKYYLVSKGIDAERIEVLGWGGKSPLYDKNGPLAYKNKRVEVEIVED